MCKINKLANTSKKKFAWCLGGGREPVFESWSEWSKLTGIAQENGKYICPDCGRLVNLTYRGNEPGKIPRHNNLKIKGLLQ